MPAASLLEGVFTYRKSMRDGNKGGKGRGLWVRTSGESRIRQERLEMGFMG
jgi:hypothetical protein